MTLLSEEPTVSYPLPADEEQRLAALAATGLLDTPPESSYDDIAILAARICRTPVAMVTLIDRDRQWYKARVGVEIQQTPRSLAFCNYPVAEKRTFVIPDTRDDARFRGHLLVSGEPHVRFYAGAPLLSAEGQALGSLCVVDLVPRELTAEQIQSLEALARQVVREIQMREQVRALHEAMAERMAIQEAIRASESVLRSFYDSSPFMMGVVELRGKETIYISINRAGLDYLGVKESSELLNRSAADLGTAPEIIDLWVRHYQKALEIRGMVQFEYARQTRRGERFLSVTVSPIKTTCGVSFPRFSYIMQDVTDRKRFEEELRHAKEEAQKASASKSQFLANMSHEIRTPMTAILGYADLLETPDLPGKQRDNFLQTIRRNGRHLLKLINDILDLSKIEAEKVVLEQVAYSPSQLISECAGPLYAGAEEKGILFSVEVPEPLPTLAYFDPTRVQQILTNLLGNALKFTHAGSVRLMVHVEAHASGKRLVFEVVDTGIGLTPEQLERLFHPFTQADSTTTRKFGGTGLGLVISRRLAQLMGGDIQVTSVAGQGARVVFWMPLHVEPAAVAAGGTGNITRKASAASPLTLAGEGEPLTGSILFAEDGVDNQILIRHVLQRAGATVEVADNGRIAVEKVLAAEKAGVPFDLILMDMQMPELDGYDATGLLRGKGIRTPIVALTANAMAGDREQCLGAGCNDFATKPIDVPELVAIIRRNIRSKVQA